MPTSNAIVSGVAHVAIYAEDPAALAAFYCEIVGLESRGRVEDGPVFIGVGPGATLVFVPRAAGRAPVERGFDHLALWVDTLADLRAGQRRLRALGLGGVSARAYGGWSIGVEFVDPEGNHAELFWHARRAGVRVSDRPPRPYVEPIDLELDDDALLAALAQPRDPRRTVAEGYDRIAERYARWAAEEVVDGARARYTAALLGRLPPGARVLELGCGGGGPTTRQLAERFELTGVDISVRQIELARRNVPAATFVHADMTSVGFPAERFDAIVAVYSLSHLPHGELPGMLGRIGGWLRPGGVFVGTASRHADPGTTEEDWLGAPMYFSGYASEDTRRFVEEAGLTIESARVEEIEEEGAKVGFLWIVARGRGRAR